MKILWRGLIIVLLLLNLLIYAWRNGWLDNLFLVLQPSSSLAPLSDNQQSTPSLQRHNAQKSSGISILKIGDTQPKNLDLLLYGQTAALKKMLTQTAFQQQILCVYKPPKNDIDMPALTHWYTLIDNLDQKHSLSLSQNKFFYLLLLDDPSNYPLELWQALSYAPPPITGDPSQNGKKHSQYRTLWFTDLVTATQAVKLLTPWHPQQQQESIVRIPVPPLKQGTQLIYRHQAHLLLQWLAHNPQWQTRLSCTP